MKKLTDFKNEWEAREYFKVEPFNMKRVYVAGRINDKAVDYIVNMHKMMDFANEIRRMGFAVFVPCLDVLMGIKFGDYTYEDYADNNMAWVEVSDILFVCPGYENSKGTLAEIKRATELNIKIVYELDGLL